MLLSPAILSDGSLTRLCIPLCPAFSPLMLLPRLILVPKSGLLSDTELMSSSSAISDKMTAFGFASPLAAPLLPILTGGSVPESRYWSSRSMVPSPFFSAGWRAVFDRYSGIGSSCISSITSTVVPSWLLVRNF